MTISDKIYKVIETRFTHKDPDTGYEYITPRDEDGIGIEAAVIGLLRDEHVQYSVDFSQSFDSPGYANYYLSIAYIYEGRLEHETFIVEEY